MNRVKNHFGGMTLSKSYHSLCLKRRIVLAPMAGGPSTPQLCAAVSNAGGLGFLAAGYLSPDKLAGAIEAVSDLTTAPYGVNIFVPGQPAEDNKLEQDYAAYRDSLIADSVFPPEVFPEDPQWSADYYEEKIDLVAASSAAYVSFTFGHPDLRVIHRLQEVGKSVVLYATSRAGIQAIADSPADVIGIQSAKAGGHRATVEGIDDDSEEELNVLIRFGLEISDKPIIAGGGVSGPADVLSILRAGAWAVQVGTLFLTTDEAGTKNTHRRALLELKHRQTMLTRSFTGKLARTIENAFARKHSAEAPALYPYLHDLTSGMRAHANQAGDPEHLNLWAGTGFLGCRNIGAAQLVEALTPYHPSLEASSRPDPRVPTGRVAVVGAGPRGLAVVERLISRAAAGYQGVSLIDWYDDAAFGAGRVWNPFQYTGLLMNTVCCQLSAFPDPSTGFGEAYVHGPTFFEWISSPDSASWLARDPELLSLRNATGSNTYTPRALYGAYLCWAAHYIAVRAPCSLVIRPFSERVVSLDTDDDELVITTSFAERRRYNDVVLAIGHLPVAPSPEQHGFAHAAAAVGATYIPPSDACVSKAAKLLGKDRVLLRGLGLTFFDYLELLTTATGGRYERVEGRLVYHPSGSEPLIYACSRRGVPYHARGINEKNPDERWQPRFLTAEYIATMHAARDRGKQQSFGQNVWPQIVKEVELAFTLAQLPRSQQIAAESKVIAALNDGTESYTTLRRSLGLSPETGFNWQLVLDPRIEIEGVSSLDDYQRRVVEYLDSDIQEAKRGNKSGAFKSALDVFRDIRNEVRLAVQDGVIADWSFCNELLSFFTPFNLFVSIGPPLYRIEQLRAAIQAGVVVLLPPDPFISVDTESPTFLVTGKYLATRRLTIDAVAEARHPPVDASRSDDPLIRNMMMSGIIAAHRFRHNNSMSGSVSVNTTDFRIQDAQGRISHHVFCYGVPTEGVHWSTAATIRPFVNSVILQEANIIASAIAMRSAEPPSPTNQMIVIPKEEQHAERG
jgi:NAD(P)H-dependent flavin oxidoreductase YrpB (nitropropane dioxygenase family)/uncharacterized NAD(P)/FAD-binding protein YdhS